jgi:hypothetical protein
MIDEHGKRVPHCNLIISYPYYLLRVNCKWFGWYRIAECGRGESQEKRSSGAFLNQIDARAAYGGARIRLRAGLPKSSKENPLTT